MKYFNTATGHDWNFTGPPTQDNKYICLYSIQKYCNSSTEDFVSYFAQKDQVLKKLINLF